MVPKSKSPLLSSLLYLNNVYYIIHIFCRLFFCVFFPISTHFFKKNLTITLYYSAIYFLATLLCTTIYCIHFYLIMWVFFGLKMLFFHVFFSQHFFVILQLFSFYYSFFLLCGVFFFSFISCNKDVFPRKFLVIKMFFLESVFIFKSYTT